MRCSFQVRGWEIGPCLRITVFVFNFLAVSDHSVVKQIAGNSETNCACVKLELAK